MKLIPRQAMPTDLAFTRPPIGKVCIVVCMGRVQVYLAEELHEQIRRLGLSPSELLQRAAREEIRRQELEAEADRYLDQLAEEVGEPSESDVEYAQTFVAGLVAARERRAG